MTFTRAYTYDSSNPRLAYTKCRCAGFFFIKLWPVHSTNWRFFLHDTRRLNSRAEPQDSGESFIDEIVNTLDRRMFCCPIGRLSVAIGDHPMRPGLLYPQQKGTRRRFSFSFSHGPFKCCFVLATLALLPPIACLSFEISFRAANFILNYLRSIRLAGMI